MAPMKRPRLASVRALARCRLRLKYVDGTVFTVDMAPLIEDSPGLAGLGDPDAFCTARIIPGSSGKEVPRTPSRRGTCSAAAATAAWWRRA